MFNLGLREHEKREEEINSFFGSINEARDDNKNQGVKCINDYSEYKKKVSRWGEQEGEWGRRVDEWVSTRMDEA